jgi:hypothetical protein
MMMDLVGGWFIIDCGQKQRQIGGGDIGAKQSGGGRIAMGWVACAGSQPRDRQKEAGPPKLGRNFSPNLWPDTTRQALLLLLPPPLRAPPPPFPCGTQASVRFSWFLFPRQICYIFGLLLLNWCLH